MAKHTTTSPFSLIELLRRSEEAALVLMYPEGTILDANAAALELYGYDRSELIGMHVQLLRAPSSVPFISRQMSIAAIHGIRFLTTHFTKQGTSVPVSVKSSSFRVGEQTYLLSVINKSSRAAHHTENAVRVKQHRRLYLRRKVNSKHIIGSFSLFSEFAAAGMWLLDSRGKILRANPALSRILGYTQQEMRGKHFLFFTLADDTKQSADLFEELVSKQKNAYEIEKRYVTKHGEIIWARVTITALVNGGDDGILCMAQIEDITREKLHQGEMQHYHALVRYSDTAIYSAELDGTIKTWNPAAERMFGYIEQEMIGQSVRLLFPDELKNSDLPFLNQLKADHAVQVDTIRRHKDGRLVPVALNASPIKNDQGEIIGVSSLTRDISAVVELQSEIAKLDRLNVVGEIAASIGHEVRNPMTTVRGYLQLLQRNADLAAYKPQMNTMIEELDRMNDIITEFLALARMQPASIAPNDLNKSISTLQPLIEAEAILQGKEVSFILGEVPTVNIDPKEVRQLLLNLVRNGLEAMEKGGKVTVSTYLAEGKAVLDVTDTGCGIPEEYLNKVGSAFFTTKPNGTGLGLPACYSIAAKHRAKLTVKTSPEGSTFRVHFVPVAQQVETNHS